MDFDNVRWLISILAPAISGLFGVAIGGWLTAKRDRGQRKYDFISKQLRDFYSPLLSIHKEIRVLGEIRVKISKAANAAWHDLCRQREGSPEALRQLTEDRTEFSGVIDYNNRQLVEEMIPSYRKMLKIFREYWFLAEDDTRPYYNSLYEFVNIWERFLSNSLPPETITYLDHNEEKLNPFYENLRINHDKLRFRLTKGE